MDEMVTICVYCDTTGLFTDDEIEREGNLADLAFPREAVRDFYHEMCHGDVNGKGEPASFEEFLDTYTADETVGLFDYVRQHFGFVATKETHLVPELQTSRCAGAIAS